MMEIELTQGRVSLVDDADYEWLNQWKWHFHRNHQSSDKGYAASKEWRGPIILMHRLILEAPPELQVDHRDGNGLNNQRSNLRFATRAQNEANKPKGVNRSSEYKGVSWHKTNQRWQAYVKINGKQIALGSYGTQEEGALAYNRAALEVFGDFAKLNIIPAKAG